MINETIRPNDTFICLGDVGDGKYIEQIRAKKKILLLGNHDKRSQYVGLFDEIYAGPLFMIEKSEKLNLYQLIRWKGLWYGNIYSFRGFKIS